MGKKRAERASSFIFRNKKEKMDERGLSGIITMVLMILLVLVAIGIIWFFALPLFSNVGIELDTGTFTTDFEIVEQSVILVQNEMENNVTFNLMRKVGEGDVTGVNVVLTDIDGNSEVVRKDFESFAELETKRISIEFSDLGLSALASVSVAGIFDVEGSEKTGGVVEEYSFTGDGGQGQQGNLLGVTINSPGQNSFSPYESDMQISATTRGDNIAECNFTIYDYYGSGEQASGMMTSCGSHTLQAGALSPGRYILTVNVRNSSDNHAQSSVALDFVGRGFNSNNQPVVREILSGSDLTLEIDNQQGYGQIHYAFADFNRDMKLWMRMDDLNSAGELLDYSTYNHRGLIEGLSRKNMTHGRFGESFNFYQDGDQIRIPGSESTINYGSGADKFTVLAWIYATNDSGLDNNDRQIVTDFSSGGVGWNLLAQYNPTSQMHRLVFGINDGVNNNFCFKNNIDLTDGRWHLVAAYFDGNQVGCAVSDGGTLSAGTSGSYTGGNFGNADPVIISSGVGTLNSWNGSIDDVMIFERTMSGLEVQSTFLGSVYRVTHTGLVGVQEYRAFVGNNDLAGTHVISPIESVNI
ncbi:hypothetical protein CO038_03405 [Candidatus Pacearchaeota archaeon CG_4_9_14_0_2_um_filter_39_13]|nr:MAG: hypothetical protein CO038_03405 [Candidatus Pacearchaeota archaeon CG_4_9_14_0_2_um_filter_39_13]